MADMHIEAAVTAGDFAEAGALLRGFFAWRNARYPEEIAIVDRYDDPAGYDAYIAALPANFSPPKGLFLIARVDDVAVGIGAFAVIDAGTVELKRIFVADAGRGKGIGRALTTALMEHARLAGHVRAVLDTGFRQVEAISLYESLGFRRILAYYECPAELQAVLIFMERSL
jgi:GNAT superfamily N-acetyltransferase